MAIVGAICSMIPDLDVLGFAFGVHYGDLLGHRGLSHSLGFAAFVAFAAQFTARRGNRQLTWFYLFLATASHGILDAFTDGGLGIAFLSPVNPTRYFFPVRPIAVSPIGAEFFSSLGLTVLRSEVIWVWIPSLTFAALAHCIRNLTQPRAARTPDEA
jgi:inner membrane protein